MRILAIARFRFWTTLRSSTLIAAMAVAPAAVGALFESSNLEPTGPEESLLAAHATVAFLMWLFHSAILVGASDAFGNVKQWRPEVTTAIGDLMDSAPIEPRIRFAGEWLGILATTLMIHLCCLPALVVAAVLSPLPTTVFVCIEAVLLPLIVLSSASAAWKRLAPRTTWSGTRSMRSGILFLIIAGVVLLSNTNPDTFRDSAFAFVSAPSMHRWQLVVSAVDNPFLLLALFATLYAAYLLFFYVSATRDPASA